MELEPGTEAVEGQEQAEDRGRRGSDRSGLVREALGWIAWLGTAVLIALALRVAVVEAYRIPSSSMEPTLKVHDRILANKFIYRFSEPRRGDVVIFNPPPQVDSKFRLVKRIVGLPGEQVHVMDGVVYIDGRPLDEPFLCETEIMDDGQGRRLEFQSCNYPTSDFGPVVVPPDQYFVMGDNRDNSEDSRYWSFLPRRKIVGKAFMRILPPSRFGLIR